MQRDDTKFEMLQWHSERKLIPEKYLQYLMSFSSFPTGCFGPLKMLAGGVWQSKEFLSL